MIENHKYQPSPIKLYLPFMMFLGTLILTSINWALFYFWKVKIAQSLIVNTIIAGICLLILAIQIVHKSLINYIKSLLLTFDIQHMLVIPAEINEFTGKRKVNATTQTYNSYLYQSYGEYRDNKLYICIRLPINIAAAKLLDDNLNKLRESIVSQNPDYSFTGFERQGYYLISEGTK